MLRTAQSGEPSGDPSRRGAVVKGVEHISINL